MTKPHGTAGGSAPDDSDLDDLLGSGNASSKHVPPASAFGASYADRHRTYYSTQPGGLGCCGYLTTCCWLTFQSSPKCGWILTFLVVAALAYGLVYCLDPTVQVGVVTHDWTTVESAYDLKAGDIDHWCLTGDDSSCRCEDPLQPADRGEYKSWSKAHKANKRLIAKYATTGDPITGTFGGDLTRPAVDVAFLGESLIEEMDGRWLGMTQGEHLESLAKMFNKRFQKSAGAALEAVPLGIAGDASPNVLWRLLHGEMPESFSPPVWWLSLGMNDLARMQCSEEVVIMGILRVVEEIRLRKPDAKIVINSLLPMTDQRSGAFPLQNDYKDAFRNIPPGYVRGRGPVGRHRIFGPRNPTVTVDSSHIARKPKPSKAIQGEKEDEDGKPYPRHLFPKKALRARRLDSSSSSSGKRRVSGRRDKKKKDRAKMTPEEKRAADLAEKKEQLQKNLEKRRTFLNRIKHDKINPILRDKASFKRRDPTKLFIKQTATPLWPAISIINNNLRRFCEKHSHVTFFDATDIFAERTERGVYILKSDMISVRGHPTEAGFRAWEDNVASKLMYMLKDKPAKVKVGDTQSQPSNVLPAGNPAVSEPKLPAAQKKEKKPKDDGISESELSGDESKDDRKDSAEDEKTEKTAKEDGAEESEEDGSGDKSEGKEENDNADSEEEEEDDDDEESSSEDTEKKATTSKKTVPTKKKATNGKAVASSDVETAKGGTTKKKATSTKKKATTKKKASEE